MKASELRNKTKEELNTELEALQKELFNLRVQKSMSAAAHPHSFKQTRRKCAQIKTILNEKKREIHE